MIGGEEVRRRVRRLEVWDRIDSDRSTLNGVRGGKGDQGGRHNGRKKKGEGMELNGKRKKKIERENGSMGAEGERVDKTIVAIKRKLGRIKEEGGREKGRGGEKEDGKMKSVSKRKKGKDNIKCMEEEKKRKKGLQRGKKEI